MRQIRVQNIKTGRQYVLSGEEWDRIVSKKLADRFTILDERSYVRDHGSTFLPEEISESARAAVSTLKSITEQTGATGPVMR